MQKIQLPGGEVLPALGLGTWYMGDTPSQFENEVSAMRYALDQGIRLIDTAEMYANGGAERVIGAAIKNCGNSLREEIFIISKVLPSNAHYEGVIEACDRSLQRLGVPFIDLYLLHWRGSVPLQETVNAFNFLISAGKIRHFGVSNFDLNDMREWYGCESSRELATNQILYNLSRRGTEWDVIPFCRERGTPVIAYSPLEQGRLEVNPTLSEIAARHGVTSLQIALAWVLSQENVIAIPKSVNHEHIDQNIASLDITLDPEDHEQLNIAFPPPTGPSPLEIL